jgi:tetratricopeptide (TPR) repeat protein
MTGAKLIKHYEELVAKDPHNVQLLQKLGELHQKRGNVSDAATYFIRVGEEYARDGYFLKAVALLKQCLKLDPTRFGVLLRLAELHVQLELRGEGLAYLDHYLPAASLNHDHEGCLHAVRLQVQWSDRPEARLHLVQLLIPRGALEEARHELSLAAQGLEGSHPDIAAAARALDFAAGADALLAQLALLRSEFSRRSELDRAPPRVGPPQLN